MFLRSGSKEGLNYKKIQIISNAIENIEKKSKIDIHTKFKIYKPVKIIE